MDRMEQDDPRQSLQLAVDLTRAFAGLFLIAGLFVWSMVFLTTYAPPGNRHVAAQVILYCVLIGSGAAYAVFSIYLNRRRRWAATVVLILSSVQLLAVFIVIFTQIDADGTAQSTPVCLLSFVVLALAIFLRQSLRARRVIDSITSDARGFEPLVARPYQLLTPPEPAADVSQRDLGPCKRIRPEAPMAVINDSDRRAGATSVAGVEIQLAVAENPDPLQPLHDAVRLGRWMAVFELFFGSCVVGGKLFVASDVQILVMSELLFASAVAYPVFAGFLKRRRRWAAIASRILAAVHLAAIVLIVIIRAVRVGVDDAAEAFDVPYCFTRLVFAVVLIAFIRQLTLALAVIDAAAPERPGFEPLMAQPIDPPMAERASEGQPPR